MIKFINVSKTYEDSDTHAINGISFNIDDGETLYLAGDKIIFSEFSKENKVFKSIFNNLAKAGKIVTSGKLFPFSHL